MSEQQVQDQPLSEVVTFVKHFVNEYASGTKTTFVTQDGRRLETWNPSIATKVLQHIGFPAKVTYRVRQRGSYTNYVILDIEASENGAAQLPKEQFTKEASSYRRSSPEERTSIHRQVAAKLAVEAFTANGIDVVAHQDEAMEWAQNWVDFFERGYERPLPKEDSSQEEDE